MPQKLRKVRKQRGSRTHGYGRVGQHRCRGSRGYRKAGRHKAGWSYVLRYEPEYFGKKGFTSPKSLKQKENVINIKELDEIAERLSTEKKEDKIVIDLESLGYTKLLGTGKATKPLVVKVTSCSKSAAEKIREAGGEVLMKAEKQGE
jgi:large subunit ribosomal protein L15